MFVWCFNRFQVRLLSECCFGNKNILVFTTLLYTPLIWETFFGFRLCSNFKDAKIKDSLREILENIVNVCFNQVTE